MLSLPNDILNHILYSCNAQTIVNLTKLSNKIRKLADNPRLWCHLIFIGKDYDDFTFCYKFDLDVISFHRECYNKRNILTTHSNYLFLIPKHIDVLVAIWNIVKNVPSHNNLLEYTKSTYPDMFDIIKAIISCLNWSMNVKGLYETFSSSLLGFFRVMISLFNWKETCRFIFAYGVCKAKTPIGSIFCDSCRSAFKPNKLMKNIVNVTGSYIAKRIEDLNKTYLIDYQGLHYYCYNNFVIMSRGDIHCIGKLIDYQVVPLSDDETKLIDRLGFIYRYKNDINVELEKIRSVKIENFKMIDGVQIYKELTYDFIIKKEEKKIICLGRLFHNKILFLSVSEQDLCQKLRFTYEENFDIVHRLNKLLWINFLSNKK